MGSGYTPEDIHPGGRNTPGDVHLYAGYTLGDIRLEGSYTHGIFTRGRADIHLEVNTRRADTHLGTCTWEADIRLEYTPGAAWLRFVEKFATLCLSKAASCCEALVPDMGCAEPDSGEVSTRSSDAVLVDHPSIQATTHSINIIRHREMGRI